MNAATYCLLYYRAMLIGCLYLSHKVSGDKTGSGASGFGDKTSSITSVTASPKEISECLSGWLTYLQVSWQLHHVQ